MRSMKYLLPYLALSLFSCSDNNTPIEEVIEKKELTVTTGIVGSRAMITGEWFDEGAELGITLVENKDAVFTYDGLTEGYYNIQYKANGTHPDQYWTPTDKPIYLSSTEGRAVAYYPYSKDDTDYKALTLKAYGQVDYMFSRWVKPINNLHHEASFQMEHAMAGIRISLKRGSYTGVGNVTEIVLNSRGLGSEGKLNAATGEVYDVTVGPIDTYMMRPLFEDIILEGNEFYHTLLMAVPVPDITDNMKMSITIDGRVYEAEGIMVQPFYSGDLYTFKLTLDNTALTISNEVEITPWEEDTTASTDNGGVLKPTV